MNCYSIYDVKSLVFNTPWFQPTHGAATRVLADLANDPNTTIGRHPADYRLYWIGTYDDAKGALVPLEILEHVMDAVALVKLQPDMSLPFPNVLNRVNNEFPAHLDSE